MSKGKPNGNGADHEAPVPAFTPRRCYCAEQETQPLVIYAPRELSKEDVGRPSVWAAITHMMKPGSIAWVREEDDKWAAECYIVSNIPGRVAVAVLRSFDLPSFEHGGKRALPENVRVTWGGNVEKWKVERRDAGGVWQFMDCGANHPEWEIGGNAEESATRWALDHASIRDPQPLRRLGR
jgi:hypothetical protein